jgi:ADP-heptose:LPS heptosyltransferase
MLGIDFNGEGLQLCCSKQDEIYIDEFLKNNWVGAAQPLVGMNLSASQRWETKSWPADNIWRLCDELALRNIRVVFTGTNKELSKAEEIQGKVRNLKPIIACGKTSIGQLICLLRKCTVFVTSDSAPLHIACAVGTPFVALFGPTDPLRHIAPGYKGVVLKKDLSCSPCYKNKCKTRNCMNKISVDDVSAAIDKLLSK